MFIVSQDGTSLEEINTVKIFFCYDDKVTSELENIAEKERNCYPKPYLYNKQMDESIKKAMDYYIKTNHIEKNIQIHVNSYIFAEYKNHQFGKHVFEKIIDSIKTGISVFDLRDYSEN